MDINNAGKLGNPNVTRSEKMRRMMEEHAGKCVFCCWTPSEGDPLLFESEYWRAKRNLDPYAHTAHHFVIVLKRHANSFDDLSSEEFSDLYNVTKKLDGSYGTGGGSFCMRFGDIMQTGASIGHLHAHLIYGDGSGDVMFRAALKSEEAQ